MEGNSNVFRNSAFGMEFMSDNIPFLLPQDLPRSKIRAPYVLIGDEAFPRGIHLVKPYSKKSKCTIEKTRAVFNYWLSRVQMCVECTFGVLTTRFHFLMRRMTLSPDVATTLVKAACVLHNYLMRPNDPLVQATEAKLNADLENDREEYCIWNYRKRSKDDAGLVPIPPLPRYHTGSDAWQTRNLFATYFHSPARYIPWQDKCACVTALQD